MKEAIKEAINCGSAMRHLLHGIRHIFHPGCAGSHAKLFARSSIAAAITLIVFPLAFPFTLPSARAAQPVKSLLEMRRENVVIQQWDLSCGAAALTTLLKYQHGENLTEKVVAASLMRRPEYIQHPELIQIREGFSLLDLKRDVEARGYRGLGYGKLDLENLIAKAPIIVPIHTRGYNHFVVFRGMRADRVLLADPAWGNRTVRVDEFLKSWIEHPVLGRVGFEVRRRDGAPPSDNRLAPRSQEFVMLR